LGLLKTAGLPIYRWIDMVGSAAFFVTAVCGVGGKSRVACTFCLVIKWQQHPGEEKTKRGKNAASGACQGTGGNNPATRN